MKCPNCGEENSDSAGYCRECAIPLSERDESPKEFDVRKTAKIIIAILVVLILVSLAVNTIYLDPSLSWDPAIRDHDGDGVPDESDPNPTDAEIWTYGSATVILAVSNDYSRPVICDWTLKRPGTSQPPIIYWVVTASPFEDYGVVKIPTWLVGNTSVELQCFVICKIEELGLFWSIEFGVCPIHDGGSYTFVVTFPDDLPDSGSVVYP